MLQTQAETSFAHDAPPLTEKVFRVLSGILREETRISLGPTKKSLMESRLRKRLGILGCDSFDAYQHRLEKAGPHSDEMQAFINCITTNKTEFFREPHHFEYLTNVALPQFVQARRNHGDRTLRAWCSGCSTGQEAYSIGISLAEYFACRPGWDIKILASDIDSTCLQHAVARTYVEDEVNALPCELKRRYFLRGVGSSKGKVKVNQSLAESVAFRQINLASSHWPIKTKFDFIFCRNVLIYFEPEFQRELILRYLKYLQPHGMLFLGHSESITWMPELESLGNTVYRVSDANARVKVSREVQRIVAGETLASNQPIEISTLLGSCVAVCLYDPIAQVGGMNHVMFAHDALPNAVSHSATATSAKQAMEELLQQLIRLGAKPTRMVAKLYGGAELLDGLRLAGEVGFENVRAVTSLLNAAGIPIVEQKVGGNAPVRIRLRPDTGEVTLEKRESREPTP